MKIKTLIRVQEQARARKLLRHLEIMELLKVKRAEREAAKQKRG